MTMKTMDFTSELSQLMKFAGLTATAIRMYSAYNPHGYESGNFGGRVADPSRSPVDLMFLSDALHHLERIGLAIERADQKDIVETCDDLIIIYNGYLGQTTPRRPGRESKPTFDFWAHLVNVRSAMEALTEIRNKALLNFVGPRDGIEMPAR
jgi:hypothetical protein